MFDILKALARQPWWVIVLLVGAALVLAPTIRIESGAAGYGFASHAPTTFVPVAVGVCLLVVAIAGFWISQRRRAPADGGLDLSRVKEDDGALWTMVADCEIRIVNGRLEEVARHSAGAVVLPCNEYFDDRCVDDRNSALGAYVNAAFEGQVPAFVSLIKAESARKLGNGVLRTKTPGEEASSFGTGRCLLLLEPLGRATPVALISTTTQRAGEGLSSRISYLFDGMRELVAQLADARVTEVIMPLMGAGHGHIEKPLALVGLLLAIAEVAHYGRGSQRLRKVTVVVFQREKGARADVDRVIVRRALALVGSRTPDDHSPR